jgi:aspartyl-tRNA(Asn)/glutamyl-tRNA(Gln) amidotransferase subunit A
MAADEICGLSLAGAAHLIKQRKLSPVEVTGAALDRISRIDPAINSFITVTADEALAAARQAEAEILAGNYRGPLHGLPISVKDLFLTSGIRTTAGSRVLATSVPDRDATVVRKLREAGAVPIGKTNLLEFAYGEVHPDFGPCRNPWNPDFGTSGSSSGSGAAVAAGLGFGSIGSDTGGSIRGPAALCGVVGLKPTYGLVSRAGALPLSWSLDHVGPMTRSVRDCAILLEAIAGFDADDPTSRPGNPSSAMSMLDRAIEPATIGVVEPVENDGVTDEVRRTTQQAAEAMGDAGYALRPVALPHPEQAARTLMAIVYAEASSIHRSTLRTRAADFAVNTRERLELGALLPATIYLSALRARAAIVEAFRRLFQDVDLLLLPVMAVPSYRLDVTQYEESGSPADRLIAGVRFEGPFNLTGQPAISVPCGATVDGLPIGVQLAGRPFSEPSLLQAAEVLERAMRSHLPEREGNHLVV